MKAPLITFQFCLPKWMQSVRCPASQAVIKFARVLMPYNSTLTIGGIMYHRFQFIALGILLGCVSKGNVYTVSVAVLDQAGKVVDITLMFSFIGDKYST